MSTPTQVAQGFETFVNWWDSNWKNMVDTMPMQNGMTIDIAFDNWGQPLDPANEATIVAIAKEIQSRAQQQGVSVNLKLSFGGATYAMPNLQNSQDALKLASSLTGVLAYFQSNYGIDFAGVDLDVESTDNSSQYAAQFIEDLRSDLDALGGSHKIISLTIPGQGWSGLYYDLATNPDVQNAVDYFQFMEYDIWQGASSFEQQIENDILTYIGAKGSPSPNPPQTCWGIPASKVRLGLMPGKDDSGKDLSPQDAQKLAQFAIDKGLSGVMIWDTFRDGGDEVGTGQPPFTYTRDILGILDHPSLELPKSHLSRFMSDVRA